MTERVSLLLFELTCDFNGTKNTFRVVRASFNYSSDDSKNDETPMNRNDTCTRAPERLVGL